MSKTLLQQLYSGEVYSAKNIVVKTPEYKELSHKISDEKVYFQSALSADD